MLLTSAHATADAGRLRHEGTVFPDHLERWTGERPDGTAFTFVDYDASRDGVRDSVTWRELDRWTAALAAHVMSVTAPGDRVAVLTPQSLQFAVAFTAVLRTHAIAVPLHAPDALAGTGRLDAILQNAEPSLLLCTAGGADVLREYVDRWEGKPLGEIAVVDDFRHEADLAARYSRPSSLRPDTVAYLQYTSGSTRRPSGVILSHENLILNAVQAQEGHAAFEVATNTTGWLPMFHDMGLQLLVGSPVVNGNQSVILDPLAFISRPVRWLREMSAFDDVVTAAPNFAYDYCAKRIKPADREGLDLSGVRGMINGAEPVLPGTVQRFMDAFGPYGLRPEAMRPGYGLAEATVFVTGTPPTQGPRLLDVNRVALQHGRLEPVEAGSADDETTQQLVSAGVPVGQQIAVVTAERRLAAPGEVAEIWVRGRNVGTGYWNDEEDTLATFGARLLVSAEGEPDSEDEGGWLRTGDLGAVHEGQLYVTGRIKDLIIIDGRNIYPQDVELSVEESHDLLALHRSAAFSIPSDSGEELVVVAERYKRAEATPELIEEAKRAARTVVTTAHAASLHDIVIIEPDTIPRTSSGKIARRATREKYLAGQLDPLGTR